MSDEKPVSGWGAWLGLGVVVAAVGCCAAGPLLGAAIAGAGIGGVLSGTIGALVLAVCAVMVMVVLLRRRTVQGREDIPDRVVPPPVDRD